MFNGFSGFKRFFKGCSMVLVVLSVFGCVESSKRLFVEVFNGKNLVFLRVLSCLVSFPSKKEHKLCGFFVIFSGKQTKKVKKTV